MSAPIAIVNEADEIIGSATKQEAWSRNLIHRIVRIMAEDGNGNILLQRRAPDKDIFPDCWDNSAAGHVDAGEAYEPAARREMMEEIGEGVPLELVGTYRSNETHGDKHFNRFTTVYRCYLDHTPQRLEVGKVTAVQWMPLADVQRLVAEHPDQVSDGLRQVMERYY
jgi:isopentenyldiphosphate isomerase